MSDKCNFLPRYVDYFADIINLLYLTLHSLSKFRSEDPRCWDYYLQVGAVTGFQSCFNIWIQTSEDPVLSQLYQRWVAPEGATLPVSEWSGLSRVCSAERHKYGFLASHVVGLVFGFRNPDCHLIHLPDASIPQSLAFALPKQSQYRRPINQK